MSEYTPVTVQAASEIADHFGKDIVVIVAVDHEHDRTHYTSYGRSASDKQFAAGMCDYIARALGHQEGEALSFEDFRTKPAAERAEENERLLKEVQRLKARLEHYECAAKSGAVPVFSEDGDVEYVRPD